MEDIYTVFAWMTVLFNSFTSLNRIQRIELILYKSSSFIIIRAIQVIECFIVIFIIVAVELTYGLQLHDGVEWYLNNYCINVIAKFAAYLKPISQ